MRNLGKLGFSLIELIVALAIMVVIASVVTPVLIGTLDQARFEATLETFAGLAGAVFEFENDTGEYPQSLGQLTSDITTSQDNVCGFGYSSGDVNQWDGPYLSQAIPSTGLPTGIGRVRNLLTRSPTFTTNPDWIILAVDSVVIEDALAINLVADNDGDDANANTVRWAPNPPGANGLVVLSFYMPMGSC